MRTVCLIAAGLFQLSLAAVPPLGSLSGARRTSIQRVLGASYGSAGSAVGSSANVFSPASYGGDPSGQSDSLDALNKAIAAMVGSCVQPEPADASETCDLNSATLDLAGGTWAVSNTVQIPKGYGNYNIQGGTLAALAGKFPEGATLLNVGNESDGEGSSAKNINIQRITINGGGIVGTGICMWNGQYVNMGPALMVYGFTDFGIRMTGTGGGYIHHSWLGEEPPYGPMGLSDAAPVTPESLAQHVAGGGGGGGGASGGGSSNLTATCISLEGDQHDCYVEDVIIWSGRIGVKSQNGANKIQGVHTWNLMTTEGGIGIWVDKGRGSVKDSYLDFCPLIVTDPKSMVVSNNLFLARGNLVLQANESSTVEGLVVSNNRWWSESNPEYKNATIFVDGAFTDAVGVTIESSSIDPIWEAKSTRATLTQALPAGATNATLDFSNDLLLAEVPIREVQCSLQASRPVAYSVSPLPQSRLQAAERGVGLHEVSVLLGGAAAGEGGSVTCTVDQSRREHPAH